MTASANESHEAILLELALLTNERRSVADVFAAFAERLLAATRFEFTALATAEPDPRYLRIAGRHPNWAGSMPVGTILRLLDLPPQWRESGIDGTEYHPGPDDPEVGRRQYERGFRHSWVANLLVGDTSYGYVTVARTTVGAVSPAELDFLRAAARLLASAVRQDRLLRDAEQEAAQSQLLNELAALLHAGEPIGALFDRMLDLIALAIKIDYVSVSVSTASGGYRMVGSRPVLRYAVGEEYPDDVAQADNVFLAAGGVLEYRPERNEGHWPSLYRKAGIRRVIAAGLRSGDQRLGIIGMGRKSNVAFTDRERRFVVGLAVMLGQAEANNRRLEQIAAAAARERVLNELSRLLNTCQPVERLFADLPRLLEPAIDCDYVGLVVPTETSGMVEVVGAHPELVWPAGTTMTRAEADLERAAPVRGVVQAATQSVPDSPPCAVLHANGIQRIAVATRFDDDRPAGRLTVGRKKDTPYSAEEAEFIEVLSTLLGQAVGNQRHAQRIEAEAARSRILNELAVLLNAGEPVDALFDRLLPLLERAIEFDFVELSVAADEPGMLRQVGSRPELLRPRGAIVDFETVGMKPVAEVAGVVQYRSDRVPGEPDAILSREGIIRVAAIALHDGAEPIGMFAIARRRNLPYPPQDAEFIESVGTIFSQAVSNQRHLRHIEAEAARARVLNELTVLLNAGEPANALFDRLLALLERAIEFDYVGLLALSDRPGFLRMVGSRPELVRPVGDLVDLETAGLHLLAAEPGIFQYRTRNEPSPSGRAMAAAGIERAAAAVLRADGEPVGMFSLGRRRGTRYAPAEVEFIEVLVTILGQAVGNQRRLEAARAEAARNKLLSELAVLLNSGEPVETVFHAAAESLKQIVPWDRAALLTMNRARTALRWACTIPGDVVPAGEELPMSPMVEGLLGQPSARVRISNLPIARADRAAAFGGDWLLAAPLRQGGLLLGGYVLVRDTDQPFSDEETRFVELLATLLTHAVANQARIESAAAEAEEQRVVATVAAAAAAESSPGALVGAIIKPLRHLIPRPFLAFGYLEGDEVVYPVPNGPDIRSRLERYQEMAIEEGQIHAHTLPSDVDPSSPLWTFGVQANATTLARSGGEPMGILITGSRQEGFTFSRRELRIFRLIAQIIGPAMENARTAERQRREAQEQRILAEVATVAAREKDVPAILAGIIAPLRGIMSRPFVAYGQLEAGDMVSWTARSEAPPRPLSPLEMKARDEGQMVHSARDIDHQHPPGHPAEQLGTYQFTITPVQSGGNSIALLAVSSRDPDYQFSGSDLSLLKRVASIVGPAIEAARGAASVAEQRALYDLILTSLTEGVIMLDSDAHVVFANAPGRALVDAIDATGSASTKLEDVAGLLPEGLGEVWMHTIASGEGARGRGKFVIDGAERWLDYELVNLRHPHSRLLVVTSDVTDAVLREDADARHRQQMEQAARLAALGELIGGVAHELNNPLTAILGFAEIIAQSPVASSLTEEVSVIQKEAIRARDIVRDLLFIARPAPIEQAEVALGEVVAHIERLRRAAWIKQGAAVTIDVAADGGLVWGNQHQLTQVLLNLVTNAEHAIEGLPRREISITVAHRADEVEIVVADSGAGMSPETAERVFEPFFTTKQGTGTGLGLSLSYSIIQSHQGQITVQSRPGAGTRFRITLPAHAPAGLATSAQPPSLDARAARVLVIDDEPSLRRVCQRLVQNMGHECDVAESSTAGLTLAASKDFDLILCDYRLATETAADVVEGLAAVAPHLIPRTVIATGATTDAGVVELTGRYGLRLIAKPYGVEELAAIIAQARAKVDAGL